MQDMHNMYAHVGLKVCVKIGFKVYNGEIVRINKDSVRVKFTANTVPPTVLSATYKLDSVTGDGGVYKDIKGQYGSIVMPLIASDAQALLKNTGNSYFNTANSKKSPNYSNKKNSKKSVRPHFITKREITLLANQYHLDTQDLIDVVNDMKIDGVRVTKEDIEDMWLNGDLDVSCY